MASIVLLAGICRRLALSVTLPAGDREADTLQRARSFTSH